VPSTAQAMSCGIDGNGSFSNGGFVGSLLLVVWLRLTQEKMPHSRTPGFLQHTDARPPRNPCSLKSGRWSL